METPQHFELMSGSDGDHERRLQRLGAEIARVAHELNTPVSLIAGSLGALDQHMGALLRYVAVSRAYTAQHPDLARAYDEARLDYICAHSTNLLAICDEGVERLRHIAGQLRGYGRRGDASAPQHGSDIGGILQRAERLARSAHPAAPAIDWSIASSPYVAGDEQALLPALVNIISNAFDAVGSRQDAWVGISVGSRGDSAVEVRIRDNGPGIADALRDRVFAPFFTTKGPGAGVGLGLAIARDAIEAIGGRIELAQPEHGAEFVLHLPAL